MKKVSGIGARTKKQSQNQNKESHRPIYEDDVLIIRWSPKPLLAYSLSFHSYDAVMMSRDPHHILDIMIMFSAFACTVKQAAFNAIKLEIKKSKKAKKSRKVAKVK